MEEAEDSICSTFTPCLGAWQPSNLHLNALSYLKMSHLSWKVLILHQLFIPRLIKKRHANSLTYANDHNYNYLCIVMVKK